MLKLMTLVLGIALLQVGCDNNDTIQTGDDGTFPEPPPPEVPTGTETTFQVSLSRSEQVPVCAAAGYYATGAATVTVSADESFLTVGGLRISYLSGPATGAHIHPGAAGVNGPILLDFSRILGTQDTFIFNQAGYPSPVPAGAPADFASMVREIKAGNSYINVHTAACVDGEIRGQLR